MDGQTPTDPNAKQQPARIAIPSFKDVQQAERQRTAPNNYFRPGNVAGQPHSGHNNPSTGAPSIAYTTPHTSAAAFLPPPSTTNNFRPPQQQPHTNTAHNQQQNYYHGAGIRPPVGGSAGVPQQQQQQQYAHNTNATSVGKYQHHPQQQQQQQGPPYMAGPNNNYNDYNTNANTSTRPPYPQQQQHHQPSTNNSNMVVANQQQQQMFNPNTIIVSKRQEGNPMLKHIRNIRWQYGDLVPDYMAGQSTAVIFISVRFHLLKPEYIYTRMKEVGKSFRVRVLLCHVDTEDAVEPLGQITRAAIANEFTLICGFSNQECARYLETLKIYEKKPAEVIQKDVGHDYLSRLNAALTSIRGVNKTDVKTLGDKFGSVASLFQADVKELQSCAGIGSTKARRLFEAFHEPFRRGGAALPSQQQQQGTNITATNNHTRNIDPKNRDAKDDNAMEEDIEALEALKATEEQQRQQQTGGGSNDNALKKAPIDTMPPVLLAGDDDDMYDEDEEE